MAENKKYVVAPGCSFVGGGKTYNEGDEITPSVFGEKGEARFNSFLSGDKPKIIPAPAVSAEKKEPDKPARKDLEKIALDNGIKEKEFSGLKDEDLEKLLKDRGFVK